MKTVALELPIVLEPEVEQLSVLPLQVLLKLYWGRGPGIAYFAGATGKTSECSAITGVAPALLSPWPWNCLFC